MSGLISMNWCIAGAVAASGHGRAWRRVARLAAAADYWFDAATSGSGLRAVLSGIGLRPWACQALCGAFPG